MSHILPTARYAIDSFTITTNIASLSPPELLVNSPAGLMATNLESQILIVGAGVFGLSTAFHLLNRGYKKVTVIDRSPILPAPDAASTDKNKSTRDLLVITILTSDSAGRRQSSEAPTPTHSTLRSHAKQSPLGRTPRNGAIPTTSPSMLTAGRPEG